jgi:hypothetical protein
VRMELDPPLIQRLGLPGWSGTLSERQVWMVPYRRFGELPPSIHSCSHALIPQDVLIERRVSIDHLLDREVFLHVLTDGIGPKV